MFMDHYINNNKLNEYKLKLKQQTQLLTDRIAALQEELKEKMSATGDVIDIASEHEKYLSTKRDMQRAQTSLKEIGKILNDFEDYGYCLDCGIEIGEDRLSINPAFTCCVECADIKEKKARLYTK